MTRAAPHAPIGEVSPGITLGEGNTPLVKSRWFGPRLGLDNLYFKLEQTNPTGSYKDRFAARLVSLLTARGQSLCLGTSSGNGGAAMAAYSAAAGIRCVLCVPDDAPDAKLTQIRAYGATLLRVRGMVASVAPLRTAFERLRAIATARGMPLGVSAYALSPEAMAGIEPLGHELVAALGAPPDRVFAPVGGGGLLVATWRGLQGSSHKKPIAHAPSNGHASDQPRPASGACPTRMHAVQAAGNDTLVAALHAGDSRAREVNSTARISGLVVPLDLDATTALRAVRASGGDAHLVPDDLVWQVQAQLARHEGLYVEPAGAVSVAGLRQAVEQGLVATRESVVCLLTGHGYKDEGAARRMAGPAGERELTISPEDIDLTLIDRLAASEEHFTS